MRARAVSVLLLTVVALLAARVPRPAAAQRGDPRDLTPSRSPIDRDRRPGSGPPSPPPLRFERLKTWVTAVEQHGPGTIDGPLREIARWTRDDLVHAITHFRALVLLVRDPKASLGFQQVQGPVAYVATVYLPSDLRQLQDLAADAERRAADRIDTSGEYDAFGRQHAADALVRRAAWLHTDLAILAGDQEPPSRPGSPGRSNTFVVQWRDGQQIVAARQSAGHLALARTILTYGRREPAMARAVALWYRATAAYLQRNLHTDRTHVDEGLQQFPRDADLLFLAAASHETSAMPRVQEAIDSLNLPYGATIAVQSPRVELRHAVRLFERALDASGTLTEARVRLGHVLGLLGRHQDAVRSLERAVAETETAGNTLLTFYARMFLGRGAEALGDLQKARSSYEEAARIAPLAQSPLVASSALATRAGDTARALDTVERLMSTAWSGDDDPWWRYSQEAGRSADAWLADARQAFTGARRP